MTRLDEGVFCPQIKIADYINDWILDFGYGRVIEARERLPTAWLWSESSDKLWMKWKIALHMSQNFEIL